MWLVYQNRVPPNYLLGRQPIGGRRLNELPTLPAAALLPATLTLSSGRNRLVLSPAQLGLSANVAASATILSHTTHTLFPVLDIFVQHHAPLQINVDNEQLLREARTLSTIFAQPPVYDRIIFTGSA